MPVFVGFLPQHSLIFNPSMQLSTTTRSQAVIGVPLISNLRHPFHCMTGISEDTHSSVSLGYPCGFAVYRNRTLTHRETLEQWQIQAQGQNWLHKLPHQMASPNLQKTSGHFREIVFSPGTPSDPLNGSNGGLHIPISDKSGFHRYNDEKHLQHMSTPARTLALVSNKNAITDGREVDRPTQRIDSLQQWEDNIQVMACHDPSYFSH